MTQANYDDQPRPISYKGFLIVWLDKLDCWCILDKCGIRTREPYWGTTTEAREAIDTTEAI